MSKFEQRLRRFDGAVAVITGGASGLGRAMAENLARRGCEVILADRQHQLADEVACGIIASGGRAQAAELNVTDHQRFAEIIQTTKIRTGRLDYLFNNAGIAVGGEVSDITLEHWHSIINVNILGIANGVHAVYPLMQQQGYGHIINTASVAGLIPVPLLTAYAMTKHAVVGLSIALRTEGKPFGVQVSTLCPGLIRTPIISGGRYGEILTSTDVKNVAHVVEEYVRPYDVGLFADKAIRAVARNKAIIVVPSFWKLFWWPYRFSPTLALMISDFITAHARKELRKLAISENHSQV